MANALDWNFNESLKVITHVAKRFAVYISKDVGIGLALDLPIYTIHSLRTTAGHSIQAQALDIIMACFNNQGSPNSFWFKLQHGMHDIGSEAEYLHWMREHGFEDYVRHITY
jgi:hypothetical protein